MKKLQAVLLGAGNRGCAYADYALEAPSELEIVAIIEISDLRLKEAGDRYSVPESNRFKSLDEFFAKKIPCDFVINATMDEIHYETSVKIMNAGYHMLLEKPITAKKEELLDLQRLAREKNVKLNICHVLRYTPYYKRIKEIINAGTIGKILTMELDEHVWIAHFVDSFVRGKWKSEATCGSGFLLAKSCHDMDLICWLNNMTTPKKVSSFGSRSLFAKKNAPEGATKYCYNCPHNETCLYSAQKIHVELDPMPFQTWMDMNKPLDTITKEEKLEWLKSHEYGLCAYESGGDINDRQVINIEFEDGSTAMFTMVGGTSKPDRFIHICGTHGEIEGRLEDEKFIVRKFDRSGDKFGYDEEIVDVSKEVHASAGYVGHGGGDYAIMHELVRYLNGDNSSISITSIDDSINGHLVVYAAEESNKKEKIVRI